jgi:hypothetical protein
MLGGKQGIGDTLDAGTRDERSLPVRSYMARLRSRQMKLALKIVVLANSDLFDTALLKRAFTGVFLDRRIGSAYR